MFLKLTNRWLREEEGDAGQGNGSTDSGSGGGSDTGVAGDGQGAGHGSDAGNGGARDWRSDLPDDLRGSPVLRDVNDVGTLAKNYIETQALVGRSLRIPSEDASSEDRTAFLNDLQQKVPGLMPTPNPDDTDAMAVLYRTLGQPEEADGYAMPEVEGIELPEDRVKFLQGTAHKYGLSNAQFKGILGEILQADAAQEATARNAHKEGMEHLHGPNGWGNAADVRISQVKNYIANSDAPDALKNAVKNDMASADTVKWLYGLMMAGGESGSATQDISQGTREMTPDEARTRISEIMNNKEHPYWKAGDPGHKAAIDRMVELHRAASPGE